jgi:hypothetical protein
VYLRKESKDVGFREASARSVRTESKDGGFREASAFIAYFIGIVGFARTQDSLALGFLSKSQSSRQEQTDNIFIVTYTCESAFYTVLPHNQNLH